MTYEPYDIARKAVLERDAITAVSISKATVERNNGSHRQIVKGLTDGLIQAAELFDSGNITMTQMSGSSTTAKAGLDALSPLYDQMVHPTVILATIEGDRHSQGKDIIHLELSGLGFDVIDLGTDVPVDVIVSECMVRNADVLVTSVIMTTGMQNEIDLENKLRNACYRDKIITCIGGPPTSQAWADRIGADIWTRNSSGLMKRLLERFPQMRSSPAQS